MRQLKPEREILQEKNLIFCAWKFGVCMLHVVFTPSIWINCENTSITPTADDVTDDKDNKEGDFVSCGPTIQG